MKLQKKFIKSRKTPASSIKDIVFELLDAYRIRGKFNETKIIAFWEQMMGQAIAKRTTNIFVHKGKLYVTLNSAPLKNELSMSKGKIVEMLAREFGNGVVTEVVFK